MHVEIGIIIQVISTIFTVGVAFGVLKGELKNIRHEIGNLVDEKRIQNGKIGKVQDWQLGHLENLHTKGD